MIRYGSPAKQEKPLNSLYAFFQFTFAGQGACGILPKDHASGMMSVHPFTSVMKRLTTVYNSLQPLQQFYSRLQQFYSRLQLSHR